MHIGKNYNVTITTKRGYGMYRFYLAAVDVLPGAVLLIPIYWFLNRVYFHSAGKSIGYCLFSCYLSAVYVLVGMPNVTYIRMELNLNLLPIIGMIEDWKNSILNVLLFVPLGLMLPLLWRKFRTVKSTVLFGFLMSLAIEVLQIFTFRATDVNDLITNTLGTLLGCLCADFLQKKFPRSVRAIEEEDTREVGIVLGITLFIMFFVYPLVSAALWDWILS